jgi:hypothetical protein
VVSTATLGYVEKYDLVEATDADRAYGYDTAFAFGKAGWDILVGVGTGGAAGALSKGGTVAKTASVVIQTHDMVSNAANLGRGIADVYNQGGLTWGNALQIGGSLLGMVGNRAALKQGISGKAATAGADAPRGTVTAGSVGGSGAGGLSMPNVPWNYGQLPANWRGATNLRTGEITIQNGLTGPLLTETVRHEAVHRWLTPIGGSSVRVEARVWGYQNSHLLKYLEEAAAQTYATGSLRQGLAFPLNGAYGLSVRRIALEGGGYIIVVGGASYGAYELSDHLLNK